MKGFRMAGFALSAILATSLIPSPATPRTAQNARSGVPPVRVGLFASGGIFQVTIAPLSDITFRGKQNSVVVSRDSGAVEVSGGPEFLSVQQFSSAERRTLLQEQSAVVVTGRFRLSARDSAPAEFAEVEIERPGWTGAKGMLRVTAILRLEDYVAAVLAGESAGFRSDEALRAMAVVARTFAVRFRGRHKEEGFDFCDTTHCQDARFSNVSLRVLDAVKSTAHELLWYQGRPAATYYHADSGGTTESAAAVWPDQRTPYLISQNDPWSAGRGRAAWHAEISAAELRRASPVMDANGRHPIHDLEIASRTPSGRVATVRVVAGSRAVEVNAEDFRMSVGRALGWNRLRSDWYSLRRIEAGGEARFVFDGYGKGHGVGLSQAGAEEMGAAGKTYKQILSFYYPGTALGLTAEGLNWQRLAGERVTLFSTQPSRDAELLTIAARALAAAESRAGWRLASHAEVRAYPSVAVYRNATGQPGWIAAISREREVHMQPADVLRAAGTLESTLRHEFLHLLVQQRGGPRIAAWLEEGLVQALESDSGSSGSTRVEPESAAPESRWSEEQLNAAILSPRSQAEMRRAYAEAARRAQNLMREKGLARVLADAAQGK